MQELVTHDKGFVEMMLFQKRGSDARTSELCSVCLSKMNVCIKAPTIAADLNEGKTFLLMTVCSHTMGVAQSLLQESTNHIRLT